MLLLGAYMHKFRMRIYINMHAQACRLSIHTNTHHTHAHRLSIDAQLFERLVSDDDEYMYTLVHTLIHTHTCTPSYIHIDIYIHTEYTNAHRLSIDAI